MKSNIKAKQLRQAIREMAARRIREARESRVLAMRGVKAMVKLNAGLSKLLGVSIEIYPGFAGASMSIYHVFADGFKDDKLFAALEMIGDSVPSGKWRSADYASMDDGVREYRFESLEHGVSVELNAKLPSGGSAACRRVKVGDMVSIVPEYKIVCDS